MNNVAPPVTDATEAEPVAWRDAIERAIGVIERRIPDAIGCLKELRSTLRASASEPADASGMTPLDHEAVLHAAAKIAETAHTDPMWDHDHQIAERYGAHVAGLIRALPALANRGGEGWQPIATAPKDGTEFWAYTASREGLPGFQSRCAWHPDAGFCTDIIREPTHWRPLPAPPTSTPPEGTREGEDDAEFEAWMDTLNEEVIQGEYGYERGEFSATPGLWRSLFDAGLSPSKAFAQSLAEADDRRCARAQSTPNLAPAPAPGVGAFKNEAPANDAGERCIFGNADCGPVVAHDDHGAPACQKCWDAEIAAGTFDPPAPAPGRDAGGTVSEAEVEAAIEAWFGRDFAEAKRFGAAAVLSAKIAMRAALKAARKVALAPGAKHD